MRNYWTCSKFADWIRGTTKLKCGTGKEWHEWEKAAKAKYPVRWWIAEEGLDHIQDVWCWIPERINDVRYYVNNRWVSHSHRLTRKRGHTVFGTTMLVRLLDTLGGVGGSVNGVAQKQALLI